MKVRVVSLLLTLCLAATGFAQTPNPPTNTPQFTLNFNALNGPGGVGTDIAATYAASANVLLREDTLIFPGVSGNYFGAGAQYNVQQLCNLLVNTNLNCEKLNFYVTGSAGVARIPVGTEYDNHAAGMFGAGANYDPSGTGQFQLVADFHLARLPGMETGWTPMVALGPVFGFGSNAAAAPQNELKRQKRLARDRARMLKLQKAAHWPQQ